jgi:menaquinone-dependent protoporphyrinogen oxidase
MITSWKIGGVNDSWWVTMFRKTGSIRSGNQQQGHKVNLVDTSDKLTKLSLSGADKVILAVLVHERRHPKAFEVAVSAAKANLAKNSTLMVSVSLKAAFPEGLEEAQ